MKTLLIAFFIGSLAIEMTTAGSRSRSCSYVNGVENCQESNDPNANFAGAQSMAVNGFGYNPSTYSGAMTGSSNGNTYNSAQQGTGDFSDMNVPAPDFYAPVVAGPPMGFGFGFGAPGFAAAGPGYAGGFAGGFAGAGFGFPFGGGAMAFAGKRKK